MVAKIEKNSSPEVRDFTEIKDKKVEHPVLDRVFKKEEDAESHAKKASGYSRMHHRHNRS